MRKVSEMDIPLIRELSWGLHVSLQGLGSRGLVQTEGAELLCPVSKVLQAIEPTTGGTSWPLAQAINLAKVGGINLQPAKWCIFGICGALLCQTDSLYRLQRKEPCFKTCILHARNVNTSQMTS